MQRQRDGELVPVAEASVDLGFMARLKGVDSI